MGILRHLTTADRAVDCREDAMQDQARRLPNGLIDFDFYRAAATAMRGSARRRALRTLAAWIARRV